MKPLLTAFIWVARWALLTIGICLSGALMGALLFPLAGYLIGMELGTREMIRNGIFDGGFFALIWAPGISFVGCLMWARKGRGECPKAP
jgi:hypothetical protein